MTRGWTQREIEVLAHPEINNREIHVLQLAADGESCRTSGEMMGLSPFYVKNLRHSAALKLGADTTTHAVAMALRRHLIV
jgi:DNA-binding CsgD family transcriptional regulator